MSFRVERDYFAKSKSVRCAGDWSASAEEMNGFKPEFVYEG
jgi:hypothetical protein